ncbi:Retrovirus-related Pol polyprotein from transposon TNT 1-94 [Hordeum vulgare]|nr:Retrovirus-related Pol polyprotein from transposon TNT 1-94 [Hordeum vulgare]
MHISRDVTFDESRPFYSPLYSSTFLVEDISVLTFPDTPITPIEPLSIRSTTSASPSLSDLPPPSPTVSLPGMSMYSAPSSLGTSLSLPPNSTSAIPLCILPFFPQHFTRRPRNVDTSADVSSSSSPPTYGLCPPPRPLVDRLGFPTAGAVVLEPTSCREAVVHPEWHFAMAEEIAALERTRTWDLIFLPPSGCPIACKWVYKIKTHSYGSLEHYKSHLVAHVFQQEHSRDYDETFSHVARMTTIHTLIVVASTRCWYVSLLNVTNAFLNGELHEEVYMKPPPGNSIPDGMVCHLYRCLYGLKQAPCAWFEHFASMVTAAGFSTRAHDPTFFVHLSRRGRTLLLIYVDDMIITGDNPEYIAFVKPRLSEQFLMSDLGPLRYCLGIEVSSTSHGFFISQEKYIQDLLARDALTNERIVETPMELNVHLRETDADPLPNPTCYHHLVASLVYLAITRPDMSYPVHILSQFVCAPTSVHYSHLLRVLQYLRGTISHRLFFSCSSSL